jgi:hypothetical protein
MRYYRIEKIGYGLTGHSNLMGFFMARRENIRITSVFWIPTGIEADGLSVMHSPLMVYLN